MKPCDFVLAKTIPDIRRNSVGIVKRVNGDLDVYFVGVGKMITCRREDIGMLDVDQTGKPKQGKRHPSKICNICHVLKEAEEFDRNQTDAKGRITRRPSCIECRKDIVGTAMPRSERDKMEKMRPEAKSVFTCPICEKRSIVGITARVTADHDHRTGKGRAWICDSCNTGLGRFRRSAKLVEKAIQYREAYS